MAGMDDYLAVSLHPGRLVLVEGEEVNTLQWCLAIIGSVSVVGMFACLAVACFQFGEPRK